jgi:L-ascorbate oxidase
VLSKLGQAVNMKDIKEMDRQGKLKRNLDRPPIKDTVTVPSGGYTIFRFYAENPGFWFMHCHIDFHSESGMVLLFKVGDEKDLPAVANANSWPQCGDFPNDSTDTEPNAAGTNKSFIFSSKLFLFHQLIFILVIYFKFS